MPELSFQALSAAELAARADVLRCQLAIRRAALAPEQVQATISIDVLASGRIRLSSTCMGVPDSSYMPLPDERGPAEVALLLAELRQRLEGVGLK